MNWLIQVNWGEGVPKPGKSVEIKVVNTVSWCIYMVQFVNSGRSGVGITKVDVLHYIKM